MNPVLLVYSPEHKQLVLNAGRKSQVIRLWQRAIAILGFTAISADAQVFFESECGIVGNNWTANSGTAFSENVYLETTQNRFVALAGAQPAADVVRYDIAVPTIGTYDIYALANRNDAFGSFSYSIDGTTWVRFDILPAALGWIDLEGVIFDGTYQEVTTTAANEVVTLFIAYQEANTDIDKFALLIDDSAAPTEPTTAVGGCFDFGDAPDTTLNTTGTGDYVTRIGNTTPGPLHGVDSAPAVFLGNTAPDIEADALHNASATGDDSGDEGEAQLVSTAGGDAFPTLSTADTSYSFEVDVTNNKAVTATLNAWIDFDQDGIFEATEDVTTAATIAASAGSTQATLSWTGLSGLQTGDTFMRVRLTTDTTLAAKASIDSVIDGEVEDYQFTIVGIDFGDAPVTAAGRYDDTDGSGTVDGSDEPARHYIVPGINIGGDPDTDTGVWGNGTDANGDASDDDTPGDPAGGSDDENGIASFPTLSSIDSSYNLTLSANNGSASAANVFAWIDFDENGSFDEDEIATVTGGVSSGGQIPASTSGSVTLNWSSIPTDIVAGNTYVRVRITTDSGLVAGSDGGTDEASTGLATDGEVEDFQLVINGVDFGDAPASYLDASHNFQAGQTFFIGAVVPDAEVTTQAGTNTADGDDTDAGGDDEEGVASFPAISLSSTGTYSVTVNTTNTGPDATLVGWIDFDGNGTFETDEASAVVANNVSASGNVSLDFDLDSLVDGLAFGATYARFRITRQAIANTDFSGNLADGEVEDYTLFIAGNDFGDAPAAYDSTAVHNINGENIRLGSINPDGDTGTSGDGIDDNLNATDDDTPGDPAGGIDDEDGIDLATLDVLSTASTSYSISLTLRNEHATDSASVFAWLDFDANNLFDEDELATLTTGSITPDSATSVPNAPTTGTVNLTWNNIGGAGPSIVGAPTNTYLRVRITTDTGLVAGSNGGEDEASTGSATDGEIEDYQISIVANLDYGDAPVTTAGHFDDTNADGTVDGTDDPARHTISSGILLGAAVDADSLTWGNGTDDMGNASDDDTEGTTPDDEDGVASALTLPVTQTAQFDVTVAADNSSGAGVAHVIGWIDFDQSGSFDEDERAATTQAISSSGNVTLSWTSFPEITLGDTYARIRMSSTNLAAASGTGAGVTDAASTSAASDGEVEDYPVSVTGMDFGDVPIVSNSDFDDTNGDGSITAADNAAEHAIDLNLFLGDTAPDSEAAGVNLDAMANGDETNGIADEGVAQLLTSATSFPQLLPTDTSYSLTIDLTNNTGSTANVYAWIDFDIDEDFDEDEVATASVANGASSTTLNWSSIGTAPDIATGNTFLRIRLTTDNLNLSADGENADDASLGMASDGEVEDYLISIGDFDFGDAPDSGAGQGIGNYRTLSVDIGAAHIRSTDIFLGSTAPDLDTDGFEEGTDSGTDATDDDNGGDEGIAQLLTSGSSFPALATGDPSYSVEVDMTNSSGGPVNVIAWIDFDQSGTFDENEVALNTLLGAVSSTTLTWATLPPDVQPGTTYARFRITSDPQTGNDGNGEDERSFGTFSNGEVEDAQIILTGTDFGDAPSIYGTFDASGGPKHGIVSGIHLGDTAPDAEGDAYGDSNDDNGNATDDDVEGAADEGEGQLLDAGTHAGDVFPVYDISDGSYSLTIDVHKSIAGTATLQAWIDWDISGSFDEDERQQQTLAGTPGDTTVTFNWSIGGVGEPNQVVGGTFARFRTTTDTVIAGGTSSSPDSLALNAYSDGEVEDYAFTIEGDINIAGNIFEDINYGGGAGRNRTTALTDGGASFGVGVTVELWDFDGSNCTAISSSLASANPATTNASGQYSFTSVASPAIYCVRVVTSTLNSTRASTGAGHTEVAIQTFRTQSSNGDGSVAQITDEVGGLFPQDVDSSAGVYDGIGGDGTATHSWAQVIAGSGDVNDLDFGYNYNTIVNTNDGGQGSLRQFILNAEELDNTGLAQDGQISGVDVSVFEIPTTDTGYNLSGQNAFRIQVDTPLPSVDQEPIYLDASNQDRTTCPAPKVQLLDNATGGSGFTITSGSSRVRGFAIGGFSSGSGISLATSGNNEIFCNYIGLEPSGTAASANQTGVSLGIGADSNTIGGASAVNQNVISGNSADGINIVSDSNTVTTNIIGLAADGLTTLGNGDAGVSIGSAGNQLGAISEVNANTIAGNGGAGVEITASASNTANAIYINSIFNNGDTGGAASARTLGIDLDGDGITANDGAADADTGANTLINFPVLGVVTDGGSNTMDVPVTLSLPDGTYRVEFYSNAVCNALQTGIEDLAATNGEGQDFVGAQDIIISAGVQNISTVNLSILGIVGNQMTAKVIDASGNSSEFSACQTIPMGVVPAATITGTVFEDVNYGGGAGRDNTTANTDYAAANVGTQSTVELWASDGNTCTGGAPLQAVTSNPTTGAYSFNTVNDTDFCVRIVNSTVQSNRTGWISSLIPVQTYRSEAADATREVGGRSPRDVDSSAGIFDAISGDGAATQSYSIVDVSGGNVTGVDFGFNFSTIVNTNSSGQGSLTQFVTNANTLDAADKSGLDQDGLSTARETTIFMVSNGAELPGLQSGYPNLLSGNSVAEITLNTDLVIAVDDVILDGTTQTNNVGGNAVTLGTGGTAGTQALALGTLNGPEVQLSGGGLSLQASDIEVRGFSLLPTTTAITISSANNGHIIENNVIGASAISYADPGSGGTGPLINISQATGNGAAGAPGSTGLIQNNLLGFGASDGIRLSNSATGWSIVGNEFAGFDGSGAAAVSLGAGVNNTNVRGNLLRDGHYGIELNNSSGGNAADSIDENSIESNANAGIIIPATASSDGANSITQNRITANSGPGVEVQTSQTNRVSENSIFNNTGLGIDIGPTGLTNGVELGSGANEQLNVPVISMADASDGINLDINGTYVTALGAAPITVELYSSTVCNGNASGSAEATTYGEGESFEGNTTVAGGIFNLSVPLSNLGARRYITAIAIDADGNTSEFGLCELGLTSDYGDAPDSYFTLAASNGPAHIRDTNLYLGTAGSGDPDIEQDGQPNTAATGDDADANGDDEASIDPLTDFALLTSASTSFTLNVDTFNNTTNNANLVGWIDFDLSGTFDNDEVATVLVPSTGADVSVLTWSTIPIDVLNGSSYIRLRITTDTSIATGTASTSLPTGMATDGEVEDYAITLAQGMDYADAPDSYDTLVASGGPSHTRSLQIYLGSVAPDGEFDGIPAAADGDPVGDDNNGVQDDEDGVLVPGILQTDTSFAVSVDVINTTGEDVTIHGWFDVNRDGNFGTGGLVDATEYTSVTLTAATGSINDVALTWSGLSQPAVNGADFSYIRVRLARASEGLGSGDWGGAAGDGEVEDYRQTVAELNCNTLYVHQSTTSVLGGGGAAFTEMRSYNPSGGTNSLSNPSIISTTAGNNIAGSSLDPITRRYYYLDRDDGSIFYDDGSGEVDTGTNLTGGGNNYNRSAFTADGTLWFLESILTDGGPLAAFNINGTGLTNVTPTDATIANDAGNAVDFTTTVGGDIAFDLDGNLYVLTYNNAASEYYVWRIQNLTSNPTAVLLRQNDPGQVTAGTQFAGAAFFTNDSLYLMGTDAVVYDWDLNTNNIVQTDNAQQGGVNFGTLDSASCIFPTLRPSLIVEKRVFNVTDVASPGFTPGDILRYRITVENIGAFFADSTTFIDQIPVNSSYIQNSTTLNGVAVPDTGVSSMPYTTATSINSPTGATGIIESGETAVIEFQVLVDSGTDFTQVCNDMGIVEFTDVASVSTSSGSTLQQGTDNPVTTASPTFPAVGGVTSDPTCSDKVSGYAISGTVYEDLDVDGTDDGTGAGENGIASVEIVLRDVSAGTCQTTSTDANGDYSFGPLSSGNYIVYEADGSSSPTPASCPPAEADPNGFESSTSNNIAVLLTNDNIVNQDFGDTQTPGFSPNNSGVILPTNSIFYAHTFAPESAGSVIFSFSEVTSPTNNGWSVTLFEDLACDGDFDVGDSVISSAIPVTFTANVPDNICILNRVTAPNDASAGDIHQTTAIATFTYGDGTSIIANQVLNVVDTTTTLNAGDGTMVLSKLVENITVASPHFDNGVAGTSNDAIPGDQLRYTISFQNISTGAVTTIDLFDSIPTFTGLATDLPLDCFNDPNNDFGNTSITDCQIASPTGTAPVGHATGYASSIQWDLTGQLAPGESGSVSFVVEVE